MTTFISFLLAVRLEYRWLCQMNTRYLSSETAFRFYRDIPRSLCDGDSRKTR